MEKIAVLKALREIGIPSVLKTRRFGYDGKGQAVIHTPAQAGSAWQKLGGRPLILEGYVPFDRELSLIAVRGRDDSVVTYPLIENTHRDGILHRSIAPASSTGEELNERATEYATRVLTELNYVGVLTIEWFQDGARLLANEMAPRVHNSGHWTIEGSNTSQFENCLRAMLNMELGSTESRPTVMLNCIGTMPPLAETEMFPLLSRHEYGKVARPGRKVGHLTFPASEREAIAEWQRRLA